MDFVEAHIIDNSCDKDGRHYDTESNDDDET